MSVITQNDSDEEPSEELKEFAKFMKGKSRHPQVQLVLQGSPNLRARSSNATKETQVQNFNTTLDSFGRELQVRGTQVDELREDLKRERDKVEHLKKENEKLRQDIKRLDKENTILHRRLEEQDGTVKDFRNLYTDLRNDLTKRDEDKTKEIEDLKRKHEALVQDMQIQLEEICKKIQ
jgi:chromosome segregation ATPase